MGSMHSRGSTPNFSTANSRPANKLNLAPRKIATKVLAEDIKPTVTDPAVRPVDGGKRKGRASTFPRKRMRRTASEIDRNYKCEMPNCTKSYGSEGALKMHMKLKHPGARQNSLKPLPRLPVPPVLLNPFIPFGLSPMLNFPHQLLQPPAPPSTLFFPPHLVPASMMAPQLFHHPSSFQTMGNNSSNPLERLSNTALESPKGICPYQNEM